MQPSEAGPRQRGDIERLYALHLQHCCKICVHPHNFRPAQLAAAVVPAPADFVPLLANVFADVGHGGAALPVKLNGGGEAPAPFRQVVNAVTAAVLVAAVHGFQSIVEEPMEMNSAVLVVLRHQDVGQPLAADGVIQPVLEVAQDLRSVVTVDALRREGERDEPTEIVAQAQVADGPSRTAACPLLVGGGVCRRLRRGRVAPVRGLDGAALQNLIGILGLGCTDNGAGRSLRGFPLRCVELWIVVAGRVPHHGSAPEWGRSRYDVQASVREPLHAAVVGKLHAFAAR